MHRWLTQRGIAPERIIMEDAASSTRENIEFSMDIIHSLGGEDSDISIITAEYHIFRAKLIASRLGYDLDGIPARTSLWPIKLNYFIRECFGVWYTLVTG